MRGSPQTAQRVVLRQVLLLRTHPWSEHTSLGSRSSLTSWQMRPWKWFLSVWVVGEGKVLGPPPKPSPHTPNRAEAQAPLSPNCDLAGSPCKHLKGLKAQWHDAVTSLSSHFSPKRQPVGARRTRCTPTTLSVRTRDDEAGAHPEAADERHFSDGEE